MLVDADNALLKIHTGLNGSKHLIGGSEYAVKETKLFVEKLIYANVGGIGAIEKVNDNHVVFLPIAVAAADSLLNALRIPWHVVVDY